MVGLTGGYWNVLRSRWSRVFLDLGDITNLDGHYNSKTFLCMCLASVGSRRLPSLIGRRQKLVLWMLRMIRSLPDV